MVCRAERFDGPRPAQCPDHTAQVIHGQAIAAHIQAEAAIGREEKMR